MTYIDTPERPLNMQYIAISSTSPMLQLGHLLFLAVCHGVSMVDTSYRQL
jgi:hypothetical protein